MAEKNDPIRRSPDDAKVPAPDVKEDVNKVREDESVKGAHRLPRKGDDLDDLRGTPTD
jgi:hypothetical protein